MKCIRPGEAFRWQRKQAHCTNMEWVCNMAYEQTQPKYMFADSYIKVQNNIEQATRPQPAQEL